MLAGTARVQGSHITLPAVKLQHPSRVTGCTGACEKAETRRSLLFDVVQQTIVRFGSRALLSVGFQAFALTTEYTVSHWVVPQAVL